MLTAGSIDATHSCGTLKTHTGRCEMLVTCGEFQCQAGCLQTIGVNVRRVDCFILISNL